MKRIVALGVLAAAGFASLAIASQQQAPRSLDVTKIKDNYYVLKGGGGNTSVFIMTNGVLVVDSKNPGWGQTILDKIKTLTDKPVVTLINTHTHGDHVSGNVEFPATVDIITQANTQANMEKMLPASGIAGTPSTIFKDNPGKGMPKHTFQDKMSVGQGSDRVDLFYFGRGHTNGDAFVFFPSVRVMHAADIFSGKNIPLLDANNGGSGVLIADTLEKAYNTITDADIIVTGHSTEMNRNDLKEYIQFNRDFLADMKTAKAAGKLVDEVAGAWQIPAKYTGYAAPAPARLKSNVQVVFDELAQSGAR